MPKTKAQGIVFGILMSFFMAYGMEVYNMVPSRFMRKIVCRLRLNEVSRQ